MGERIIGSPDEDLRIGPYDVFRTLVTAPGTRMVEARDSNGEQRLLQVAHLRAPKDASEEADLAGYIRMVATATAHFEADPDVRVLAHRSTQLGSGVRALFWALPWREGADRLGHAAEQIQSPLELIDVAIALLERLEQRHDRGRLDPLLSEHLVIVRPDGGAVLAGVPIHLPPAWMSPELGRPRLAPEEQLRAEPTRSGDLWRLGHALRGLGASAGPLPAALTRMIDAFCDPSLERRTSDPARATRDLRLLRASLGPGDTAPDSPARSEDRTLRGEHPLPANETEPLVRAVAGGGLEDTLADIPPGAIAVPASLRAAFERTRVELQAQDAANRAAKVLERADRAHGRQPEREEAPAAERPAGGRGMMPPLANMRSAAPDHGAAGPAANKISEAPTILEMKPPSSLRARAASALEAHRRRLGGGAPEGEEPVGPSILGGDTIVDDVPVEIADAYLGEEPTIDAGLRRPQGGPADAAEPDARRAKPRARSMELDILDPFDPASDGLAEPEGAPARRPISPSDNAWERAKHRPGGPAGGGAGRAQAALAPKGPTGTVVGVRIGPAGTLVGVTPLRAKDRIAEAERRAETVLEGAEDASGAPPDPASALDPSATPRGGTVAGVPSLRFRGRDGGLAEADVSPIGAPAARSIRSYDTGDFVAPAAPRVVVSETSDDLGPAPAERERPRDPEPDPEGRTLLDQSSEELARAARDAVRRPPPGSRGEPEGAQALPMLPPVEDPLPAGPPPDPEPPQPPPAAPTAPAPAPKPRELPRKLGIAAALAGGIAVAVLLAGRQIVPDRTAKSTAPPSAIKPSNEVTLSVTPKEALIVGELDGRVLGPPPVHFLVPPGSTVPVLITARGREPQRLLLPDRGSMNISLEKLRSAEICDISLLGAGKLRLEGVLAEIRRRDTNALAPASAGGEDPDAPRRYEIPGMALIRGAEGGGAWIVACPHAGGEALQTLAARPAPEERRLHVVEPENLLFFVDGRLGGATPFSTTVQTGFARVRLETPDGVAVQRWIPIIGDTHLTMPPPSARNEDQRP